MGGFSMFDMFLLTKPTTFNAVVLRWGQFTPPMVAAGCLFGVITSVSAKYREKNDWINHMYAGAAAAPLAIAGLKPLNGLRFGTAVFVGGLLALYFKRINDAGRHMYYDIELPNVMPSYSRREYNDPIFRPN